MKLKFKDKADLIHCYVVPKVFNNIYVKIFQALWPFVALLLTIDLPSLEVFCLGRHVFTFLLVFSTYLNNYRS